MRILNKLIEGSRARYQNADIESLRKQALATSETSPHESSLVASAVISDVRKKAIEQVGAANDVLKKLAEERIIGTNDLVGIEYLELGLRVSNSVGRIQVVMPNGQRGFGTGFMVSSRLLLTNHHVFEQPDWARDSFVEFNYQANSNGQLEAPISFEFDPNAFFYANEKLDFALVAVKDRSTGIRLRDLGYLPLNAAPGKAQPGESLSIIQHPSGQPKQVAIRKNELLKALPEHIWYSSDTTPGSSGAPVLNDQWQVVALHHSGVPRLEGNQYIGRDGKPLPENPDEQDVDWIANEGVRISVIVNHLNTSAHAGDPLLAEVLRVGSTLVTRAASPHIDLANPNELSAYSAAQPEAPAVRPPEIGLSEGAKDKPKIEIDPDYAGRQGYDPDFLPGFRIDCQQMVQPLAKRLVPVSSDYADPSDPHVLKYHHYSVYMHAKRRLAALTAVNIDGKLIKQVRRAEDKWSLDPRIDKAYQIDNAAYLRNTLQRGHLVRRLDPAWGRTERIARRANDDTFHYTNCAPQHERFNKADGLGSGGGPTWGNLEDFILENTDHDDLRVSVFTAPIFDAEDDMPYRGILVPIRYWKVAAWVDDQGAKAVGFIMDQRQQLEEDDSLRTEEALDEPGELQVFQVKLSEIAQLTKLDFSGLQEKSADPLEVLLSKTAEKGAAKRPKELESAFLAGETTGRLSLTGRQRPVLSI